MLLNSSEERLNRQIKNDQTLSNDNVWIENGSYKNPHLKEKNIAGLKATGNYRKEHPILSTVEDVAPLAIMAAPVVATSAPAIASTIASKVPAAASALATPGSTFWMNPLTKGIVTGTGLSTGVDLATYYGTRGINKLARMIDKESADKLFPAQDSWGQMVSNGIKNLTGVNLQDSPWTAWIPEMTNPGWYKNPTKALNAVEKAALAGEKVGSQVAKGTSNAMRLFNSPVTGNWTNIKNKWYRLNPNVVSANGPVLESSETVSIPVTTLLRQMGNQNINSQELLNLISNTRNLSVNNGIVTGPKSVIDNIIVTHTPTVTNVSPNRLTFSSIPDMISSNDFIQLYKQSGRVPPKNDYESIMKELNFSDLVDRVSLVNNGDLRNPAWYIYSNPRNMWSLIHSIDNNAFTDATKVYLEKFGPRSKSIETRLLGRNGKPIVFGQRETGQAKTFAVDNQGNIILDSQGKPVSVPQFDSNGNPVMTKSYGIEFIRAPRITPGEFFVKENIPHDFFRFRQPYSGSRGVENWYSEWENAPTKSQKYWRTVGSPSQRSNRIGADIIRDNNPHSSGLLIGSHSGEYSFDSIVPFYTSLGNIAGSGGRFYNLPYEEIVRTFGPSDDMLRQYIMDQASSMENPRIYIQPNNLAQRNRYELVEGFNEDLRNALSGKSGQAGELPQDYNVYDVVDARNGQMQNLVYDPNKFKFHFSSGEPRTVTSLLDLDPRSLIYTRSDPSGRNIVEGILRHKSDEELLPTTLVKKLNKRYQRQGLYIPEPKLELNGEKGIFYGIPFATVLRKGGNFKFKNKITNKINK